MKSNPDPRKGRPATIASALRFDGITVTKGSCHAQLSIYNPDGPGPSLRVIAWTSKKPKRQKIVDEKLPWTLAELRLAFDVLYEASLKDIEVPRKFTRKGTNLTILCRTEEHQLFEMELDLSDPVTQEKIARFFRGIKKS